MTILLLENQRFRTLKLILAISPLLMAGVSPALALTPAELIIVTNNRVKESSELGSYYMKQRGVPTANLLQVSTSPKEQITRETYDKEIAAPLRKFLLANDTHGTRFRCIVLMYGIPLHILPAALPAGETSRNDKELARNQRTDGAAVDSELALVMEESYPLPGWVPNRFFVGFSSMKVANMTQKVLLTSRLDGSSAAVVRRIIDDSLAVEKQGLTGNAYFDARWPAGNKKHNSAYTRYDLALHETAALLQKKTTMHVVLDERERLLQPGEAPDSALYCGWYSLAHYIDAFAWAKGAVGFHVASAECTTLKDKNSKVWCKEMLEKGVSATVGPVAEPYLQSFPAPQVFFGCLMDGRATLAECYALSNPVWSWQMVLIGDPLYRPFKHQHYLLKNASKH